MAWVGAVVQAGMGIYQAVSASQAAKKLPDAKSYGATPQMKRAEEMALRRAEQGVSPAERALFEQGMARRTSAANRAMRNIGMSGVAQGVSNIFNIDAMNQFSAQSEAERRKGEAMYAGIAGQMQGIQDRETTSFNQMLNQQRTALGQAAASGFKNITGAVGTAAQSYNTNKLAEAYANSGDTINIGTGTDPMGKMAEAPDSGLNLSNAPKGFGLESMQEGGSANAFTPSQDTLFGLGQQTTPTVVNPINSQSFYDPSAANAFNSLNTSPDYNSLYNTDFGGFTSPISPESAIGPYFDQYNMQNMLGFTK